VQNHEKNYLCLICICRILFSAVIIWHSDDGENDIDEVERAEEDDDDEEEQSRLPIGAYYLEFKEMI